MATAVEKRNGVIATMRSMEGKYSYRNDWVYPTLAQMKARRAGDCSDLTHAVFGAYGYKLGAMARHQANNGKLVAKWRGKRGGGEAAFNKIYKKVKKADIICMDLTGAGNYTHVETIVANQSGNSIGHGWGIGPKEQNLGVSWLLPAAYSWEIRRIIPDDKTTTTTTKVIVKDGLSVKGVQKQLKKAKFYSGKINGKADAALANAITKYQKAQKYKPGLKVTGVWDRKWQAHYLWVKKLQKALNKWRAVKPKLPITGHHGTSTRAAVKQVQTNNYRGAYWKAVGGKPVIDSIPGKGTCKMLGIPAHP